MEKMQLKVTLWGNFAEHSATADLCPPFKNCLACSLCKLPCNSFIDS